MAEDKYSYSKLETYEQCGFKFKLQYIDGHYVFSNSIATELGTAVHACEEAIGNALRIGLPIDYTKLKNELILKKCQLQAKYPTDYVLPDKVSRLYEEKITGYLQAGIYRLEDYFKNYPNREVVACEQKFSFKFEGYTFSGFIDRIIRDKETGQYIVQDIKTWSEAKDEEGLKTPLQFVIYTMAVADLYNVPEEFIICQYDLPFCHLTQDAGTKGYMNRGRKKLSSLLKKIENKEFAPSPSPLCHWCNFCMTNENAPEESKYLCPYFSHWLRENKTNETENEWAGMENHQAILEAFNAKYGIKITK